MPATVRDLCVPHPEVLSADPAPEIADLVDALAVASRNGAAAASFFDTNYVTGGMKLLFEIGFRRLAGRSDQATFALAQSMGGGKTHLMIALALLAREPSLRRLVLSAAGLRDELDGAATVVAVSGRDNPAHYIWGEIAAQLGKAADFRRFWAEGPKAPDEAAWLELLGDAPVLILLDELPGWFDNAFTVPVGGGTLANVARYALATLFSAALKTRRVLVVVSNLDPRRYPEATRDLEAELRRSARIIEPVSLQGGDVFAILRKRLFRTLPDERARDAIAESYVAAVGEAVRARTIPRSPERLADEIHGCYPFHPRFADIVATFRNNEGFRQTRGLLRLAGRIVKCVWSRPANDVHLIGVQHADLDDADMRAEILPIAGLPEAIAHDVADNGQSVAEAIDAELGSDAGSQVAHLLLFGSIASGPESKRGLSREQAIQCLIAPERRAERIGEAFDALVKAAWYLHRDRDGVVWFTNQENLTKRLQSEAERAPDARIQAAIVERLETVFAPRTGEAYEKVLALPEIAALKLGRERTLIVVSPDNRMPPEQAQNLFEGLVEKNNLLIVSGDPTRFANIEKATRALWAAEKVLRELPREHPQREDTEDKRRDAQFALLTTIEQAFNRIWYPGALGAETRLLDAPLALKVQEDELVGEPQIARELVERARKLVLDWEPRADQLIQRIEDQLWSKEMKKLRWDELLTLARQTPRFLWLPPKGLDGLRRIAVQKGRWREAADGFVERGPFEKAKTSVSVTRTHRDPDTGEVTLEVGARDAGPRPVIRWSQTGPATSESPELKEFTHRTRALRLWFLAIDPTGTHPTGEATAWVNEIAIRHEPRRGSDGRVVEIAAVPPVPIRFTVDGTNPREHGRPYDGPVPVGAGQVVLRVVAEAEGVSADETFHLPAQATTGEGTPRTLRELVDARRPATLAKRLNFTDTEGAFRFISELGQAKARAFVVTVSIGSGEASAHLRLGRVVGADAAALEATCAKLRGLVGDAQAKVSLLLELIEFPSGADLIALVEALAIEVANPEQVVRQTEGAAA